MPAGTAGRQAETVSGSERRFRSELKHKNSLEKSFILLSKWKLDRTYIEKTVLIFFFACNKVK